MIPAIGIGSECHQIEAVMRRSGGEVAGATTRLQEGVVAPTRLRDGVPVKMRLQDGVPVTRRPQPGLPVTRYLREGVVVAKVHQDGSVDVTTHLQGGVAVTKPLPGGIVMRLHHDEVVVMVVIMRSNDRIRERGMIEGGESDELDQT